MGFAKNHEKTHLMAEQKPKIGFSGLSGKFSFYGFFPAK
jgi:hypothetical protein